MLFRQVSGELASPCGGEGGEVKGQLVGRRVLDQRGCSQPILEPSTRQRVGPGAEQGWQRKAPGMCDSQKAP